MKGNFLTNYMFIFFFQQQIYIIKFICFMIIYKIRNKQVTFLEKRQRFMQPKILAHVLRRHVECP